MMTRTTAVRTAGGVRGRLRAGFGAASAGLVVLLTGTACSFGPNDLPSVRAGVSVDYDVTLKFASVMNLPTGADVVMNGLRIGEVRSLEATDDGIDVIVGLTADARVPADTGAIIRQNTLLGDTYIALTPTIDAVAGGRHLEPGGVVPVERTTSPPQLEDTIAVLAHFVNGGSIQKAQETMATLNRTVPPPDQLTELAGIVAVDLEDLAANTADIDGFLHELSNTAASINAVAPQWQTIFSPGGAEYWDKVANQVVSHISTLLPSLGTIFSGGMWLVPMLNSLADTVEAGRGNYDDAALASARLTNFLRTTLLPFAESPRVNVTSVTAASGGGGQLIGDAENLLRMLGAIR